jgi:CRISPR-associated exonuclease Cas4
MGIVLLFAALSVCLLFLRAASLRRYARVTAMQAGVGRGQLVSIDMDPATAGLADLRQANIVSIRRGISGRPDRVIASENGYVPVEVKSSVHPPNGPRESHVAQLAVYCLLVEEQFGEPVKRGILAYQDREVAIPFNEQRRTWVERMIREVQQAKVKSAFLRRSHSNRARCRSCGFGQTCGEALSRFSVPESQAINSRGETAC